MLRLRHPALGTAGTQDDEVAFIVPQQHAEPGAGDVGGAPTLHELLSRQEQEQLR